MGVRRLWLVFAVFLFPGSARAGDHNWDAFLAGSYLSAGGSTLELWGGHAAIAVTIGKHPAPGPGRDHGDDFSLIADMSAHYLGGDDLQLTLMVGPRWNILGGFGENKKHMPFVHVLPFGIVHRAGGSTIGSISSGALAAGVGYDLPWGPNKVWAPRVQIDYIRPVSSSLGGGAGDGVRFSVGAIYRSKH